MRSSTHKDEMWVTFGTGTNVENIPERIVLNTLKGTPEEISEENMAVLKRFVVLLYDRTSSILKVNELQQKYCTPRNPDNWTTVSRLCKLH